MSTGTLSDPGPITSGTPLGGVTPSARPPEPESPRGSIATPPWHGADDEELTSADFRRKFTIDEMERLYDLGFFSVEDRYELIDGDLIEMARIQPPHASAVNRSSRELQLGLGRRASVITQNAMRLGEEIDTQPQPDVTVAKDRRDGYARRHPFPADISLAIEIMETTHRYDRNVKLPKYAKAGLRETWLVDLPGGLIEVHRRPADGIYLERSILKAGDSISPEAFPDLVLSVSEILGIDLGGDDDENAS